MQRAIDLPFRRARGHGRRFIGAFSLTLAAGLAASGSGAPRANASDHNEPQSINAIAPGTIADAGDIYGNFVWPTDDTVVFITTFPAPPQGFAYLDEGDERRREAWDESLPNAYDDRVLYATHVDVDYGAVADRNLVDDEITMFARFGYDAARKAWGVRVDGIPGQDGAIEGPIGRELQGKDGVRVQAGLFDEPFFVDLERFFEGLEPSDPEDLASAKLAFRKNVSFFDGYNVHAIVVEVPKSLLREERRWFELNVLNVWTTTHRTEADPFVRPESTCRTEIE